MIIGVAIRQDGTVYGLQKPNRHHDVIRHMVDERNIPPPIRGEQGFYDEESEFISREKARELAIESGQCKEPRHRCLLFSEDLW